MTKLTDYCRQSITTKYLGPTNTLGARIVARTSGGGRRKVYSWDYALDASENHAVAATMLFESLEWNSFSNLVMGSSKDGYVFVQVPKENS